MKHYILAALMTLAIAVPGTATASPMSMDQAVAPKAIENPESDSYRMDPQLVEAILKAVAQDCSYTYTELNDLYVQGVVTITKDGNAYLVTDGGGLATLLMDESI
jgi:hypothetical protein